MHYNKTEVLIQVLQKQGESTLDSASIQDAKVPRIALFSLSQTQAITYNFSIKLDNSHLIVKL